MGWQDDAVAVPAPTVEVAGLDGKPAKYTRMDFEKMSHSDLVRLRDRNEHDSRVQEVLAPYEHQAFAREWTNEMPLVAVPSLVVATPGYYIAKKLGFMSNGGTATPASLEQMRAGFKGMFEGVVSNVAGKLYE